MVIIGFNNGTICRSTTITHLIPHPYSTIYFTVATYKSLGNILRRSLVQLALGRQRIMAPPKQATLGYVKGQSTLGCVNW